MTISLIAAIDNQRALGLNNSLLCSLPNDLKYFKETTLNSIVIMGRKTHQSIGRPLPKRTNIVLTSDVNYEANGCYVYHSVHEILHEYHNYGEDEANVFIIGGEQVYKQFIDHADYLYLTRIHHTFDEADTYFPKFNELEWELISNENHYKDDQHAYDYSFQVYKKNK